VNGHLSNPDAINQGIVQGSGIGPQLYIIMKSDLKSLTNDNILLKYAYDITLLVSEHFTVDIATEFLHAQAWAAANKLCLNTKKTKEIVLHQPRARPHYMPLPLDDMDCVVSAKLLGVIFQKNFEMDIHVNFVLSQCNHRVLRSQGLSTIQLVSQDIIVSRLRYALPAWSGFLTVDLINRIQSVYLKRLYRYGYTTQALSFNDLTSSCAVDLFRNVEI